MHTLGRFHLRWLQPYQPYAALIIRVVFGLHLVMVSKDTVFSSTGLAAFAAELASKGVPLPYLSAVLSASAEFFGGMFILMGFFTRLTGFIIVGNFVVAILTSHLGDPYSKYYPALHMLTIGVFAVLTGPSIFSVDKWLTARYPALASVIE